MKLLLVGDSGVGKSSLLHRYYENEHLPRFISTLGIDFRIKTVEMDGKKIKLQIWDTAGQERFRSITTIYYRGAQGIIVCYDVTDEKSFHNVRSWFDAIDMHAVEGVNKLLVGCKVDLEKRKVSIEAAQALAKDLGCKYIETSSKDDTNVQQAFEVLMRDVKDRLENNPPDSPVKTEKSISVDPSAARTRGGCC